MKQDNRLDDLLKSKSGVTSDFKVEWGWQRYLLGGKMFAALCEPGSTHAAEYAGHLLLTLKCEPLEAECLRKQYEDILPGFYMDKRNWISVRLDGTVPETLIEKLCEDSYQLIFAKLTKKLQKELQMK